MFAIDTLRDFVPIAQVVLVPLAVAVPADLLVRNVQRFIALARSRPGQVNIGAGGTDGLPHLAFMLFHRQINVDVVHVPYRGNALALQDLIGGRVQFMIDAFNLFRSAEKAGRVRVIATTGRARMPVLPDVQTVAEQRLPDTVAIGWQGLVAQRQAEGRSFMEHKSGYMLSTLLKLVQAAGFAAHTGLRLRQYLELWVMAWASDVPEAEACAQFARHLLPGALGR